MASSGCGGVLGYWLLPALFCWVTECHVDMPVIHVDSLLHLALCAWACVYHDV